MSNKFNVTPLGTVSPFCHGNCNCPGYLVEYGNNKVLLDCGNGITRLLKIPEDLNNLIIIISHLHKDHYGDLLSLGYASFIAHNLGYLDNKVKVYIPSGDVIKVDENYTDIDGWGASRTINKSIIDYDYLMQFNKECYLEFISYKHNDLLSVEDLKITFCSNPHQLVTYSTKLEVDNIKLVYSSDTGYVDNSLEMFAKDANILICESTFLKGQQRIGNNHLYAHEASMIAKTANVEKLLLTHFYPTLDKELYVNEAKELFANTEAAVEGKKIILRR